MSKEEYQSTVTQQMESNGQSDASSTVLGVAAGEDRYLISMTEVNEVIPIPKLARVPLTLPWFLGLVNVRGSLYGITDLGVYLGGNPVPFHLKSRILLVSPGNKIYGGFMVNSMLGIRNLSEFTPTKLAREELIQGIITQYEDTEGRLWQELSLLELMRDKKFLQIACK